MRANTVDQDVCNTGNILFAAIANPFPDDRVHAAEIECHLIPSFLLQHAETRQYGFKNFVVQPADDSVDPQNAGLLRCR